MEGGDAALLPAPALLAASGADQGQHQQRTANPDLPPPLLLAPLERVGRGNAAVWNCSEDYGCNSSDSEWYRDDDEEEEKEEEEEQMKAAPPSADLLLPWDFL